MASSMSLDPNAESVCEPPNASQFQEAIDDFLRRRDEGEAVSEDTLFRRFPADREEITRRLAALAIIDQARLEVEREHQESVANSNETRIYSSSNDPKRPTTSNRLWIRCPHCQGSNAIAPDAPIDSLNCSGCLKVFSLLPAQGSAHEEPIGAIAHFHLYERIGMGGFGAVWKAFDSELERTVAIKIPRKDRISAADVEQFLHEARVAAQLSHPHIVTIHEIGRWEDLHYIVSDFVEGASLTDWIKRRKPKRTESAKLCALIARALHEAHECGIIHRDLKPGNILIDEEGEPHLTDFGLAKTRDDDSHRTKDGQVMGTPAYMSPEQAKGDSRSSDCRTDVYSLGVVLFELLTGELPFRGNARALIHQVIHNEAPSPRRLNHNIEHDLETICLKCLQKEPKRRFATALEVAEELERFIDGEPIQSRPIDSLERAIRWTQRNSRAAVIAALGIFVLVAVDFLWAFQHLRDRANRFAVQQQAKAQHVADAVHQQLARYRYAVHEFSENARLKELLASHQEKVWPAEAQAEVQNLTVRHDHYLSDPASGFLLHGEGDPFENWFVMDLSGEVRGHSPAPQVDNYAFRDYFRGALQAAEGEVVGGASHPQKTYVSRIYKSLSDGAYKFGISAPIYSPTHPKEVVGVVMASILAGRAKDKASGTYRSSRLTSLRATDLSSFNVLVGPFDDSTKDHPAMEGAQSKIFRIVQHPAYSRLGEVLPTHGVAFEEAVEFHTLNKEGAPPADIDYHDPLGVYAPEFNRRWIAGFAVVPDTQMLIVTQDSYDDSVAPLRILVRLFSVWGGAVLLVFAWISAVLVWRLLHQNAWGSLQRAESPKLANA